MKVISLGLPRSRYLERGAAELGQEAQKRLRWFDYYRAHGRNAALTCRYFGVGRQTFYRGKRRDDPQNLSTLEDRSHQPHHRRHPTWTAELAERVLGLRRQYPRWGKDKLAVLLRREGRSVSASRVGRILSRLKARGVLIEPPTIHLKVRRRPRPYARRKPRDYRPQAPGDLVEVDRLELRPLPGVTLKQFTARDVVSRWHVLEAHTRATATLAAGFLDTLRARLPFPLRALQVDGGSEFAAPFEEACRERGLELFLLPPRSPKLNGHVERANRTPTEEFYEITPSTFELAALNRELRAWEHTYNTVRPHQALGYLTPAQFLAQSQPQRKEPRFH
jgi:transposase InsO family protein